MVNLLNANSVSHSEVRIQSAYIASIVIVFDVTLTLPPSEQTTALLDFLDFFTSVLTSFGGYDVREGNRGSTGIAAACKCFSVRIQVPYRSAHAYTHLHILHTYMYVRDASARGAKNAMAHRIKMFVHGCMTSLIF